MFLVAVAAVVALLHLYLWKRLVRDTTRAPRARRAGTVTIIALALLVTATLTLPRLIGVEAARWLAWPGYVWLALFFYLVLILAILELPRLALRRWARATPAPVLAPAAVPPPSAGSTPDPATVHPQAAYSSTLALTPAPEPAPAGRLEQGRAPGDGWGSGQAGSATPGGAGGAPPEAGAAHGRRLFLARGAAAVAGVASSGLVGTGMVSALGAPEVRRITVPIQRLDPAFAGFRIAVVSDIHLGPMLGRSHTERLVRMINETRPDLVAVVGDLVDGTVPELGRAAEPLRDLVAREGSFFVTGNHEYYSGHQEWVDEIGRLGLGYLRNERTRITRGGAAFDLAGVTDITGRASGDAPDLAGALAGRDATRPVVLLAHQPVQVGDAARAGVDLQLSGHTHGGQMYPFHHLVQLAQPSVAGLSKVDDTWLYVSRGAGFWGPPVRVGAPPEVAVVELTTAIIER